MYQGFRATHDAGYRDEARRGVVAIRDVLRRAREWNGNGNGNGTGVRGGDGAMADVLGLALANGNGNDGSATNEIFLSLARALRFAYLTLAVDTTEDSLFFDGGVSETEEETSGESSHVISDS